MDELSQEGLREALSETLPRRRLRYLGEIDSTNRELMRWLDDEPVDGPDPAPRLPERLVLASQQSAGYGRQGRRWHSPGGANLYISAHFLLPSAILPAQVVLTAAVALRAALADALAACPGQRPVPMLKWPNDIVIGQDKLCGLLAERRLLKGGLNSIVLGVGVNVNMVEGDVEPGQIDQGWTSLRQHSGVVCDRAALARQIIGRWPDALGSLESEGLAPALLAWGQFDALAGREIALSQGQERVCGSYLGIDGAGRLRIKTADGVRTFDSADVSISASQGEPRE